MEFFALNQVIKVQVKLWQIKIDCLLSYQSNLRKYDTWFWRKRFLIHESLISGLQILPEEFLTLSVDFWSQYNYHSSMCKFDLLKFLLIIVCIIVQTLQNFKWRLKWWNISIRGMLFSHPLEPSPVETVWSGQNNACQEKQIFDCFYCLIHPPWCQVKEFDHLHPDCVFISCVFISNEAKYIYKINVT